MNEIKKRFLEGRLFEVNLDAESPTSMSYIPLPEKQEQTESHYVQLEIPRPDVGKRKTDQK